MRRFVTLLDNAIYLPVEYIQKEKEYGIPWRTAFKKEALTLVNETQTSLFGVDLPSFAVETDDPFMFFHKIVKKNTLDAATLDASSQADLMCMMIDNLEEVERCIYVLKALMKEPDFLIFTDLKRQTIEQIQVTQRNMHPNKSVGASGSLQC